MALFVGTYTFSRDVSHNSNHFSFSSRAHPGWSLCVMSSLGFRMVLLIMKATPTLPVGLSGSSEVTILRFLLKHSQICTVLVWSRCEAIRGVCRSCGQTEPHQAQCLWLQCPNEHTLPHGDHAPCSDNTSI